MTNLTPREIIHACGGAERVAQASGGMTVWMVWKWYKNGIPSKHWPLVMRLSGLSADAILSANEQLRQPVAA